MLVRAVARFAPFARFARFAGAVVFPAGKLRGRQAIMDPMIFLDDTETYLVADSRREALGVTMRQIADAAGMTEQGVRKMVGRAGQP